MNKHQVSPRKVHKYWKPTDTHFMILHHRRSLNEIVQTFLRIIYFIYLHILIVHSICVLNKSTYYQLQCLCQNFTQYLPAIIVELQSSYAY